MINVDDFVPLSPKDKERAADFEKQIDEQLNDNFGRAQVKSTVAARADVFAVLAMKYQKGGWKVKRRTGGNELLLDVWHPLLEEEPSTR